MLQCLELKGFLPDISFRLALSIKHVVLWQEKSDDRGGQRVCVCGEGGYLCHIKLTGSNFDVKDKA